MKISFQINIGSNKLESKTCSSFISFKVKASLRGLLNQALICLDNLEEITASQGDKVTIEAGYEDNTQLLFSGEVSAFEEHRNQYIIEATSSLARLHEAYIDSSFESVSSGSIVSTLLADFNLEEGNIEDGLQHPWLVFGRERTIRDHLEDLALKNAFVFYADKEDKLNFCSSASADTVSLLYGGDISTYEITDLEPAFEGIEVYGDSPVGSGQGEDAVFWLKKSELKGLAGKSSGRMLRCFEGFARNQDLVDQVAENLLEYYSLNREGSLRSQFKGEVSVGSKVKLEELPQTKLNGEYLINSVEHSLNAEEGLITDLKLEACI